MRIRFIEQHQRSGWRQNQFRTLFHVSNQSLIIQFKVYKNFNSSNEVVKQKDDITDGLGYPDWQLTLYLLLAWIAVYLVIVKGVKSSGKISYFLAIFPYAVMLILLVRAVTLDGAWEGIKYFIKPDFKRILEIQVKELLKWLRGLSRNFNYLEI